MALQVFCADQHPFQVTTVVVDQVPWFKGKEVAACLAYTNTRKAVRDHVDEEDRKAYAELIKGVNESSRPYNQQLHEVYINESGIYSLVRRSHQEEAKEFKNCKSQRSYLHCSTRNFIIFKRRGHGFELKSFRSPRHP